MGSEFKKRGESWAEAAGRWNQCCGIAEARVAALEAEKDAWDADEKAMTKNIATLNEDREMLHSRVAELEDDKKTLLRAANGDLLELQCLKDAGVDNWGGWEQAQAELEELLIFPKPDQREEGKS